MPVTARVRHGEREWGRTFSSSRTAPARRAATCPTRRAATSTSCFAPPASRPTPRIDPSEQIAFYDGGLGSRASGEGIRLKWWRRIYNLLAPGDGPRHHAEHHRLLRRDHPRLAAGRPHLPVRLQPRRLHGALRGRRAEVLRRADRRRRARRAGRPGRCSAISNRRGASPPRPSSTSTSTAARSSAIPIAPSARRAPTASAPSTAAATRDTSNTAPYFIGVWDTVGTLGAGLVRAVPAGRRLSGCCRCRRAACSRSRSAGLSCRCWRHSGSARRMGLYLGLCLRYRGLASLARYRMAFYDTRLHYAVRYARHALAIDENRRKFECVPWQEDHCEDREAAAARVPARFKQVWFAGSHSDIGGSYPDTESRLSDIALAWMVEEARQPARADRHRSFAAAALSRQRRRAARRAQGVRRRPVPAGSCAARCCSSPPGTSAGGRAIAAFRTTRCCIPRCWSGSSGMPFRSTAT